MIAIEIPYIFPQGRWSNMFQFSTPARGGVVKDAIREEKLFNFS